MKIEGVNHFIEEFWVLLEFLDRDDEIEFDFI